MEVLKLANMKFSGMPGSPVASIVHGLQNTEAIAQSCIIGASVTEQQRRQACVR